VGYISCMHLRLVFPDGYCLALAFVRARRSRPRQAGRTIRSQRQVCGCGVNGDNRDNGDNGNRNSRDNRGDRDNIDNIANRDKW
jgi:hypothetical protein